MYLLQRFDEQKAKWRVLVCATRKQDLVATMKEYEGTLRIIKGD